MKNKFKNGGKLLWVSLVALACVALPASVYGAPVSDDADLKVEIWIGDATGDLDIDISSLYQEGYTDATIDSVTITDAGKSSMDETLLILDSVSVKDDTNVTITFANGVLNEDDFANQSAFVEVVYTLNQQDEAIAIIEVKMIGIFEYDFAFASDNVIKSVEDDKFINALTINGEEATDVVYESSNEAVVTVDELTGEVTIVGPGTAYISVKKEMSDDGKYSQGAKQYFVTINGPQTNGIDGSKDFKLIFDQALNFTDNDFMYINGNEVILTESAANDNSGTMSGYPGYVGIIGTCEKGSIIVNINKDFIKFLQEQKVEKLEVKHVLKLDGEYIHSVNATIAPENPKTSDNVMIYVVAALFSLSAIVGLSIIRRTKKVY